jgi:hypothetical protein
MNKVALLISLAVSVLCFPAQSQTVTFFSENDTIPVGESDYRAEIKVSDFQQIVGAQFTLHWDSTVLDFADITDFGFDLSYDDNFGREQTSGGILRFAWFNAALTGIDLPDSTTLFTVQFKVRGAESSKSPIAFIDEPTTREVYDTSFAVIPADFSDGSVMVAGSVVNTLQFDPEQLGIRSLVPNPLADGQSQLKFFQRRGDTLVLRIVSMSGAEVFRAQGYFAAGEHTFDLPATLFPQTGMYIVQIKNNRFITTDKLLITE